LARYFQTNQKPTKRRRKVMSDYSFIEGQLSADPTEIHYGQTSGFILSNLVLVVKEFLLQELGRFIYNYETALRKLLVKNPGVPAQEVLFQGLDHQLWQRPFKQAFQMPGLVRLDMSLDPLGIFEVQPRPGGLGIQTWFQNAFGYPMVFVDRFIEMARRRSGKENPRLLFLVTEDNPRYMAEMSYFIEEVRRRGVSCCVAMQGMGSSMVGQQFDAVYVRGRFDGPNKDIETLLGSKLPFIVPPNHFFHSKATLAILKNVDGWETFIPPTQVIDQRTLREIWDWKRKERREWVLKPANDWGANDVDDGDKFSDGQWRRRVLESLSRGLDGKSPFVLQAKRTTNGDFVEFGDKPAKWILRACFTLGDGTYDFAGGVWNARVGTIRIHGASDALMGLAVSSTDNRREV
jgi:hypothetical protein